MSHGPHRGAGRPLDDWRDEHLPINRDRRITKAEREERARACLEAVKAINEREAKRYVELGLHVYHLRAATAASVAAYLHVSPAHQLGSGAKSKRSWSGSMNPALRVAPTLKALAERGELVGEFGGLDDYRYRYHLPGEDMRTIYDRLKSDV